MLITFHFVMILCVTGDRERALMLRDLLDWYGLTKSGDTELALLCAVKKVEWWSGRGVEVWWTLAVKW